MERLIHSDVGVNCNQCLVMGCLMWRKPFYSEAITEKYPLEGVTLYIVRDSKSDGIFMYYCTEGRCLEGVNRDLHYVQDVITFKHELKSMLCDKPLLKIVSLVCP